MPTDSKTPKRCCKKEMKAMEVSDLEIAANKELEEEFQRYKLKLMKQLIEDINYQLDFLSKLTKEKRELIKAANKSEISSFLKNTSINKGILNTI